MVTRGLADPRRADPSQHRLDKELSDYITFCSSKDPAPRPQQALPSSTILWIAQYFGSATSVRLRTVANLVVLAFFFLLRVGEYTRSTDKRTKLTVPIRRQDVKLWHQGHLLAHDLPLATLLTADAVTIRLENQKNGFKGAVLHHYASRRALCPVRSAVLLVHPIAHLPRDTGLGTYISADGAVQRVSAAEVRACVQAGAAGDGLENRGYDLARIGSHSLRSGGATHLKLCGCDELTIMKLGRWSSNTYLRYIQTQIGDLAKGLATKMANILRFHNVS
jgi:hypothetical protein